MINDKSVVTLADHHEAILVLVTKPVSNLSSPNNVIKLFVNTYILTYVVQFYSQFYIITKGSLVTIEQSYCEYGYYGNGYYGSMSSSCCSMLNQQEKMVIKIHAIMYFSICI